MENKFESHYQVLSKKDYTQSLKHYIKILLNKNEIYFCQRINKIC